MSYQFGDHQMNGSSPFRTSFNTTSERPSSLSEPVSLCQSPSSSDGSSFFNIDHEEGFSKKGVIHHHKKKLGKKSGSFTFRVKEHVKLGSKLSETVKGKLSLGAKVIREGGRGNIFKQIFGVKEEEELLKASQCYLSTSGGPIAGLLFISTHKIAFCSERPITIPSSTSSPLIRTHYKVVIPVEKIKRANQSENENKPEQKYIEIATEDGFEFWFMGFLRYEKAFKNLEKALKMANQM